MNEYVKIALETRKKVSRLTLEQQKQVLKLYEDSIASLATKAAASKDKSLTKRWLLDYSKELKQAKTQLAKEIKAGVMVSIEEAAKIGTEPEQLMMKQMFQLAEIDVGEHFNNMFSQIPKGIVEDIVSGSIYKDHKTLSQRIWNTSNKFENDIQYVVNRGMLEKKSALELARDLEMFVKEPAKRGWDWSKVYPKMKNIKIDYNAQRLARTAINHSYQTASIKSSNRNPFVEGIQWRSALIHGRTCQLCRDRHEEVFPKNNVPLDHPNGLCTMIPHIPKDLDKIADELRSWIDGGSNSTLDDWYDEYGEYFAFKRVGDSYNN